MMKKTAGLIVVLLQAGCVANPLVQDKDSLSAKGVAGKSYHSHCLKPQSDPSGYILYGYGSGQNLREARLHAYQDLAEQLKVKVNAQATGTMVKQGKTVTRGYSSKVETSSQFEFEQLQLDCLDNNDPSGEVHVGLKFDNRPLAQILADKLTENKVFIPRWQGAYPLVNSVLLKNISQLLKKKWGLTARHNNIHVRLYNRKGLWYLQMGGLRQNLDLAELLPLLDWQHNAQKIQLSLIDTAGNPLRLPLVQYQNFRLQIKAATPGYISLLTIDEKGKVLLAEDGLKVQKQLLLPKGDVYEAVLAVANQPSRDILLLIYSKQPLSWSKFNRLQRDRSYQQLRSVEKLDTLLEWLRQEKSDSFSSLGLSLVIVP